MTANYSCMIFAKLISDIDIASKIPREKISSLPYNSFHFNASVNDPLPTVGTVPYQYAQNNLQNQIGLQGSQIPHPKQILA